ncbi:MAG: hypothetical protein CO113_07735 [Elusimicrobia bacterium CG_4_9_14_3_um_filter_62_55]|nr:MAG: hypothetical protein COR54_01665 [Elusimicrobia bacterium CG22_combo_CG10-13_8_21_14_all_63_91]PJA13394.1 MAG: hypothetical protein COX66_15040 [Elusimicrobia bacterium CG_4_10_14_0_2_um_filter_63_34]PJB25629.1 MAG: hypothetical protein CO113_07735 [Elusimicrobia bacterium CG_4_9_14_3_um_filter_62_55]
MKLQEAEARVAAMRTPDGKSWKNKRHVATTQWRDGMVPLLSREPELKDDGSLALVEIFTAIELPGIDEFTAIFKVDERGIWYSGKDSHLADAVHTQRFIPWSYMMGMTMHELT